MTTILVTRPAGGQDPLVRDLGARGYSVVAVPTVITRARAVEWPDLEAYDWIVVTSVTGVECLPKIPRGRRWAAVGESTASALQKRGARAALIPSQATGLALAHELPDPNGSRVLLVRASLADADLPAELRRRGAHVDEVTAYETVEGPAESSDALAAVLSNPDLAAVVFASGSAVRGFLKLGGSTLLPAITIGPRTTAVAREVGFVVKAEAEGRNVKELADAVERAIPIEVGRDA